MRSLALGRVVSRIAALWCAHEGKRQYARIKAAWARMVVVTRGHLLRRRFIRMRGAATRVAAVVRGWLVRKSAQVESLRQLIGLVRAFATPENRTGKPRRRLSARWEVPPHGDFMGVLVPGTTAVALQHGALLKRLAGLSPPQRTEDIAFADYVLKIRQTYKARLLFVGGRIMHRHRETTGSFHRPTCPAEEMGRRGA